jgi:hypothetical protein
MRNEDERPINPHVISFAARGFVDSLSSDQRRAFRALFGRPDEHTTAIAASLEHLSFLERNRPEADCGGLLLSALDYALPRSSSAPGMVADEITRQWPRLTTETRLAIRAKISDAVTEGGSVTMEMDRVEWRKIARMPVDAAEEAKHFEF